MRLIKPAIFTALLLAATASITLAQEGDRVAEARRLTNFGVDAALRQLWDEASFRWHQAIGVYPNFPAAHNNLAVVYEHSGKYDEAREHYSIASELSRKNRYVDSNNRMFEHFFNKLVKQREKNERSSATPENSSDDGGAGAEEQTGTGESEQPSTNSGSENEDTVELPGPESEIYHKVGSPQQVLIKHPKRQTPMSDKYRSVYVAGFAPVQEDAHNLNFETTEYLRSELRKHSLYEVIPLEELALPQDEDEFYDLIEDEEFWRRLGSKVGADLLIYGRVNFYSEPADGFYPYEYRDYRTGDYRTAQLLIQRTAFTVELDLYFHNSATGELIHEENFGQTIVFRGRLDLTLQAFFDVMNRILPRFMDILVPREHDAIRFLLKG